MNTLRKKYRPGAEAIFVKDAPADNLPAQRPIEDAYRTKPLHVMAGVVLLALSLLIAGWNAMRSHELAVFQSQVHFSRGTLPVEGFDDETLRLSAYAQSHPKDAVVITGHAAPGGNAQAAIDLSLTRAKSVADRFVAAGVDANRITILGAGDSAPLERLPDEADIAYAARNARVSVAIGPAISLLPR